VDSLQRGDQPDYEGLFELFPQNYHEPYYTSYTTEDFGAIARAYGLTHIRDVKAFVSNPDHSSRLAFCPPGRRPHAVDPSVWIGLRQLAVQRIGD